ncbi:S-adenosylmethionine decarboxylase [Cellulomonas sp. DKR-3]|uniref:S-adenosylmethionine decarboxylase n=1 Tax=Cellulomonas fulva TaxID=2835530 RepID=A0ABS5TVV2_9CELL|nr:S-adenosylmethionine decarboxylase [Cellulomonas fulva]MBT0993285.1 S-adenosylmethionine decarboxylase [Cellulomonas fulva]
MPGREPPLNHVYVFDVLGAGSRLLDDAATVRAALDAVVERAGLHPVGAEAEHRFAPHGLSLAILLAESHVAVHTWPEHGAAYVTLTSCRRPPDGFAEQTRADLARRFAGDAVVRTLTPARPAVAGS